MFINLSPFKQWTTLVKQPKQNQLTKTKQEKWIFVWYPYINSFRAGNEIDVGSWCNLSLPTHLHLTCWRTIPITKVIMYVSIAALDLFYNYDGYAIHALVTNDYMYWSVTGTWQNSIIINLYHLQERYHDSVIPQEYWLPVCKQPLPIIHYYMNQIPNNIDY